MTATLSAVRSEYPKFMIYASTTERDDMTAAGIAAMIETLRGALKLERDLIIDNHWTANVPRYDAIRRALKAERAALDELRRKERDAFEAWCRQSAYDATRPDDDAALAMVDKAVSVVLNCVEGRPS